MGCLVSLPLSTPKDFPEPARQCANCQCSLCAPSSQQPVIQRQLMSEALNLGQMLEVWVLRLVGGREHIPRGKCLLPTEKEDVECPETPRSPQMEQHLCSHALLP